MSDSKYGRLYPERAVSLARDVLQRIVEAGLTTVFAGRAEQALENLDQFSVVPDFSRLQVGKHDVLVLRISADKALDLAGLDRLKRTLEQHLGFEGVIVQLEPGMDIERLSEEDARKLHRALHDSG